MNKTFQLGQFRKTNVNSYMTTMKFTFTDIQTTANYSGAIVFMDKVLKIDGSNPLKINGSYYLDFSVFRLPDTDQMISVYLKKSTGEEKDRQNLYTYTIEKGVATQSVPIELIINPADGFDEIIFELQRIAEDYSHRNPDGTHGRKMNINIKHFTKLNNILDYIGISSLAKIGVQGPPGLLMSINGEEIRIGKSGIYEMMYNMAIDFIGFVIKDSVQSMDGQDYFVMDYQY